MTGTVISNQRVTAILLLAAKKANPHNAAWFREDQTGFWRSKVEEFLGNTAEKAAKLGMSEDAVNAELATYMNILALDGQIARAKGKQ